MLLLAGAAATTAAGMVAVAILGDGYFEIVRHLWLAAYLLDVTEVALVGGLVGARDLGDDLKGLVAYDERLLEATKANGIPVSSPR